MSVIRIYAGLAKAYEPYTPYSARTFSLTEDWEEYSLTFEMQEPGDDQVKVFLMQENIRGIFLLDL